MCCLKAGTICTPNVYLRHYMGNKPTILNDRNNTHAFVKTIMRHYSSGPMGLNPCITNRQHKQLINGTDNKWQWDWKVYHDIVNRVVQFYLVTDHLLPILPTCCSLDTELNH